ncbi:hypothetical protein AAVH_04850 [Aphelenchoides avenae]|nr:hypothetical protein AAVH_04850 [Aphelenchus avenae]
MAERAKLRKRRQALQDEIMNKQAQCLGIQKKEDELDDEWNRLVLLLLSQVVPSEPPESNSEQPSAYESADEPSMAMVDSEEPSEQVKSEMDSEACTKALQQLFADDLFTVPLEGLNYSSPAQSNPRKHSLNDSIADTPDSSSAPKKRRKLQKYSLAELRLYAANINRHWDRQTKQFQCPLCDMDSRKPTAYNACLHFLDHLGEERYFPYKCPADDCKYASVQQSSVQMHCTGVHKMIWTDELKAASTDAKNKALIFSIFDEGMCTLNGAKVETQE